MASAALRDVVLAALARRIAELEATPGRPTPGHTDDAGDPILAGDRLSRIDRLVRPFARRLYCRARGTAHDSLGGGDELKLARLTFLALVGEPLAAWTDGPGDDGLAEACAHARRLLGPRRLRSPPFWLRAPSVSVFLGALLCLATVGIAGVVAHGQRVAPHGIYLTGGEGTTNAAYEAVFREALPAYVRALARPEIAADGQASGERIAAARSALERSAAFDARLAAALTDLARDAAVAETVEPADLRRDIREVDEALEASGAPYFLDGGIVEQAGDGGRALRTFMAEAYRVERVTLYRVDGALYRAFRLRRLDDLPVRRPLLGYTAGDSPAALVLEDEVQSTALNRILPALAEGAPFSVVRGRTDGAPAALDLAAGRAIRRDLAPSLARLPRPAQVAAVDLAGLLSDRQRALERFGASLASSGSAVLDPAGLVISDAAMRSLAGAGTPPLATTEGWAPFVRINTGLAEIAARPEVGLLVAGVAGALADDLERHEIVHRFDYDHPPRTPPELTALLHGADATRATAELSAYTAELAQDGCPEGATLALLAGYLLDPAKAALDEAPAATALFEGLVGHPLRPGGDPGAAVDPAATAQAVSGLLGADPGQVRARARWVYRQLFGTSAPQIELVDPVAR